MQELTASELAADYRRRLTLPYTPSDYQVAFWRELENGKGDLVVEAVAGSGKTDSGVNGAKLMRGSVLYVAFNKPIAVVLGERLAGTSADSKTIHSLGFGAIRFAQPRGTRVEVETGKYRSIVRTFEREVKKSESLAGRKLTVRELRALDDEGFPRATILKLVDLARVNLLDFEGLAHGESILARTADTGFARSLIELCYHHALDLDEDLDDVICEAVKRALVIGSGNVTEIDFTDMIWLPSVHGYKPKRYSFVFVDEAQDLSRAQLELVRAAVTRGGRMVFVGDRRQAIYGFAGADSASFQNIIDTTDAKVLPLAVCYRCPTSHLELARELCPQIEAAPDAPEGIVRTIKDDTLVGECREGDLVLCRVNAPLLRYCFQLIASGISAAVRGRDIGAGLCRIVDDIDKTLPSFDLFADGITEWSDEQKAIIVRRGGDEDLVEDAQERVSDQAECIRVIYGMTKVKSAEGLKSEIEALFDNERPSVVLSSVHRAKGLEENRVFIVEPERLRNPRARRGWMLEQEHNLHYVALTRAKSELVFVEKGVRA